MKRAAVIIGVDRAGQLTPLHDAAAGAARMACWAASQGYDVTLISDAAGKAVEIRTIRQAVRAYVDHGSYEKLLIYFAGHGVNIRFGEYWLLSDAPIDPQAAVNVTGSATLARYCSIPHVIFMSDACRTAAEGLQAQNVSGSEIFANEASVELEQAVDQFYACALGRPAFETRDVAAASTRFRALYTDAAIDALSGALTAALTWEAAAGAAQVAYVRPRDLKRVLAGELALRLRAGGMHAAIVQTPDARICSEPDAWIARLENLPPALHRGAEHGSGGAQPGPARAMKGLLQQARRTWLVATKMSPFALPGLKRNAGTLAMPAPCTFAVEGVGLRDLHARRTLHGDGRSATLEAAQPGDSVLLALDNGVCALLPALPAYRVTLTVREGELAGVAYEPEWGDSRWYAHIDQLDDLLDLRAMAEHAMSAGELDFDGETADMLRDGTALSLEIDPALALYLGYACDRAGKRQAVDQLARNMERYLGAPLFDLAMLAMVPGKGAAFPRTLSPFPLLSQGWSRLDALGLRLPAPYAGLERKLLPSLWTAFTIDAFAQLRDVIDMGG